MAWHEGVQTGLKGPIVAGLIALFGAFGGFAAWAALAPIEGAVIAPATVAVQGRNKVVQHLEGGIVKQILIKDGQKVAAGAPLLVLDGTAARSEARRLRIQLATIEALETRTMAERDGAFSPAFPAALIDSDEREIARLISDQRAEFEVRQRKHQAEISALEEQIAALEEQIAGHTVQREQTARQLELTIEERKDLESLLAKGLTRKSQVLELKRTEAELKGRSGQLSAAIADANRKIAEVGERIEEARSTRISEASAQLSDLRFKHTEVMEKLRAAEDVSRRLVVRAPAAGIVINLAKHNAGAVITPGQELMTIVPEDTGLVVEARVRPQDIDEVRVGQSAWLAFSAFDARQTPPVAGRVAYVSADRFENERTGEPYYLARLEIAADPASGFDPTRIGPGHMAEVFITTSERTFFGYLAAPLTKTLTRSFRES